MLDPKLIRNELKKIVAKLTTRGITIDTDKIFSLEEQRKTVQTKLQALQNERNANAKKVGQAKAKGEDVEAILKQTKNLSDELTTTENKFNQIQNELNDILSRIPNIPHDSKYGSLENVLTIVAGINLHHKFLCQ